MDFYIDIGFAVLLRLLRDRRQRNEWVRAFKKVYDAIGLAFNAGRHVTFDDDDQLKAG